jgi:hypothetical protein
MLKLMPERRLMLLIKQKECRGRKAKFPIMGRKDAVDERWIQRCGTLSKCDMLSISGMLVERHGAYPLRMAGILRCISDATETRALM